MKKSEMIELFKKSTKQKAQLELHFKYHAYDTYWFPYGSSDKLLLALKEDDFITNGFSIRRFRDLTKIEPVNNKTNEIIRAEKVLDSVVKPDIDLTDWHSVFLSLSKMNKNIIIQYEDIDEDYEDFWIGRIEKVLKSKVIFRHFDANGIWREKPEEIRYSGITTVSFDNRYVTYFSKYV